MTKKRLLLLIVILIFFPIICLTSPYTQPPSLIYTPDNSSFAIGDVIGEDGRVKVADTTAYPYRTVCKLFIFFGAQVYHGTGVLVGRNHLLTAAHNIYRSGMWASSVYAVPGKAGPYEPYGQAMANISHMHIFSEYFTGNMRYDVGLIELTSDIGNVAGWMEWQSLDPTNPIYTGSLKTAGYPGDLGGAEYLYESAELGQAATYNTHYYYLDTEGGQSGAPVWYVNAGTPYILTIHTMGFPNLNNGCRISLEKHYQLVKWINEDHGVKPELHDRGIAYRGLSSNATYCGRSFSIWTDIANTGNVESEPANVSFYLSTNSIISRTDILIGTITTPKIPAGQYCTATWTGPFPTISEGTYYCGYLIDQDDFIAEQNEGNNTVCFSEQIIVDNAPPQNPTDCTQLVGSTVSGQWQEVTNAPQFSWSGASDSSSGVKGYNIYWGTNPSGTSTSFSSTPSYTPTPIGDGIYYLRLRTQDRAGNMAPWITSYVFQYDGIYPQSALVYTAHSPAIVRNDTILTITTVGSSGSPMTTFYKLDETSWNPYTGAFTLMGLSQSSHRLDYYAQDAIHVDPLRTEWLYLDTAPPTNPMNCTQLVGSTINGVWQNVTNTPQFSWTGMTDSGSGIEGYFLYWGSNPVGISSTFISSSNYTPDPVPDGTYYLRLQARDLAGYLAPFWDTLYTFKCDIRAPQINLTSTALHLSYAKSDTVLSLIVSDGAGVGIRSIEYRIDTGEWQNYTNPFTLAAYPNGIHTLAYRSVDWLNQVTLRNSSVHYDSNFPSNPTACTQLHQTTESGVWQNATNTPQFSWTGQADGGSGIEGYFLYWGSDPAGTSSIFMLQGNFTPASVPEGIYYLRVRARDWAGNLAPDWTTIYLFQYDGTPPHSSLLWNGTTYITSTTPFVISATDANPGSGVNASYYRVDGGTWQSYIRPFTLTEFADGWHLITYYSVDQVNRESPQTISLYLDLLNPTILSINFSVVNTPGDLWTVAFTVDQTTCRVYLMIAGQPPHLLSPSPNGTYSYTWNTAGEPAGKRTITLQLTDRVNHSANYPVTTYLLNPIPWILPSLPVLMMGLIVGIYGGRQLITIINKRREARYDKAKGYFQQLSQSEILVDNFVEFRAWVRTLRKVGGQKRIVMLESIKRRYSSNRNRHVKLAGCAVKLLWAVNLDPKHFSEHLNQLYAEIRQHSLYR